MNYKCANLKLINLFRHRLRLPCLPDRQAAGKGRSFTSGEWIFRSAMVSVLLTTTRT
jgi:hypothetical protein